MAGDHRLAPSWDCPSFRVDLLDPLYARADQGLVRAIGTERVDLSAEAQHAPL
jgi:hypothetical protein